MQEWTLRVNMFEAMLYAVLKTLSAQGVWSGTVHPVVPGKVSQFWLGNAEELTGSGSRSAKTKVQKVELVRKWLAEEGMLQLEGEAKELGRKYLKKMEGGKNAADKQKMKQASQMQKSQAVGAETGKLDDLADCLLQGMAWIRWEENRQAVISKGLAALNSFA